MEREIHSDRFIVREEVDYFSKMVKDHTGRHPREKRIRMMRKVIKRRRKLITKKKRCEAQTMAEIRSPVEVTSDVEKILADGPESDQHSSNSNSIFMLPNPLSFEHKDSNTVFQSYTLNNLSPETKPISEVDSELLGLVYI